MLHSFDIHECTNDLKFALIKLTPLHLWLMKVEREATTATYVGYNCADKSEWIAKTVLKTQELKNAFKIYT